METNRRVLIVSDDSKRRKFIEYGIVRHKLEPVSYPNFLSVRKALQLDPLFMVIVDMQMPIEQKLALVEEAVKSQRETKIVTIEKKEYLESVGFTESFPSVVVLDSIASFPGTLDGMMNTPEGDGR
jgi:DNA-binding NtrC family response regulator